MKKYFYALIVAFFANTSMAHNGNDGWVTAVGLTLWSNTYGSDIIRLEVTDGYYNPATCTDLDSYMVSTLLPTEAQQRIYSTLLGAIMAGKQPRLRLDTNSCEGGRPKVLNVTIN